MLKFAFFLKTYCDDEFRAKELIKSWNKYNVEMLPMFLMCPDEDISLFKSLESDTLTIIPESRMNIQIFAEDRHWTKGYLNQEIYKLAFWELGLCENYQCLDSDALFIRPFYLKDFMYDENVPYTTLFQDNDLKSDPYYYKLYWNSRMEWLKKIEDALDYHPYKLLTCHGFQIFSAKVLRDFKENYLKPNGYSYKDIICIAPYEFSWYNLWLQKTNCIPIHLCDPNFRTFHLKQHHIAYVLHGMKIEDWAKGGYVGIVVNSNYGIGNGDYYDLDIYDAYNAEIPIERIEANYRFYKKLRKGSIKALPQKVKNIAKKVYRKLCTTINPKL